MKNPSLDEVLTVIRALIEASALPEDDPWDEVTVDMSKEAPTSDIRAQGIERGEAERSAKQGQLDLSAASSSPIVKSYNTRHWQQMLLTMPNGFWVLDMGEDGPIVQSLSVKREGRPYALTDAKELADFEERFQLDRTPWPGNIVMSMKKVI